MQRHHAIANIPRAIYRGRPFQAFLSSAATTFSLTFLFGAALFPNLVISTIDPAYILTIYSASYSLATLKTMEIIAAIGIPLVLSYTGIVYWVFRGKVKLDDFSY